MSNVTMTSGKQLVCILLLLSMACCITESVLAQHNTSKCDYSNETLVWMINATDYQYVHLNCSVKAVNFKLNHSIFDWFHVKYIKHLVLVDENKVPFDDPKCRANKSSDGYYRFNLHDPDFGKCSKNIMVNTTTNYIHVKYSLCVVPDFHGSNITRDSEVYVYFSCVYYRHLQLHLYALKPIQDSEKYIVPVGNLTDINLKLYRVISTFDAIDPSDTVISPSVVYLETAIDVDLKWNITLQALHCYATPGPNRNDIYRYDIIHEGCPAMDEIGLNNANNVVFNFMGKKVKFSFTAFHWRHLPAAGQKIYIHCGINICNRDKQDCTKNPPCPQPRRRRAIPEEELKNLKHVTAGPFKIVQPGVVESKCNKVAMNCHFDCAIDVMGHPRCICPRGAVLGFDGKTCLYFGKNTEKVIKIETTMPMLQLVHSALIVAMVFIVVVSCVAGYVRRRPEK